MKIKELLKKIRRKLVRFLTRDWIRKGIALIFAVAVFLTFARQLEVGHRDIPVEVKTPPGLIDHSVTPVVKVTYEFDSNANIGELTGIHGVVTVDGAKFMPHAKYLTTLTEENFNFPSGFKITKIEPSEIELNLERQISKKIRVEPNLNLAGRLPRDYRIESVTLVPAEIEISGGEGLVSQITSLPTRALPLDASVTENFNCVVEVDYPEGVNGITEKVQAKVAISKYLGMKKFSKLPLSLMYGATTPEHFRPDGDLPTIEVVLEGPVEQLDSLRVGAIRPYLDLSNIGKRGEYTLNVDCLVSNIDGVIFVRAIDPERIKIKLK